MAINSHGLCSRTESNFHNQYLCLHFAHPSSLEGGKTLGPKNGCWFLVRLFCWSICVKRIQKGHPQTPKDQQLIWWCHVCPGERHALLRHSLVRIVYLSVGLIVGVDVLRAWTGKNLCTTVYLYGPILHDDILNLAWQLGVPHFVDSRKTTMSKGNASSQPNST